LFQVDLHEDDEDDDDEDDDLGLDITLTVINAALFVSVVRNPLALSGSICQHRFHPKLLRKTKPSKSLPYIMQLAGWKGIWDLQDLVNVPPVLSIIAGLIIFAIR
jgi:hypothetical protein